MDEQLQVTIPGPKYRIGATVLALINHQPRYARIEQAHLAAHFVLDDAGIFARGALRWEYDVRVLADPIEASENIIIAEQTILLAAADEA